MERENENREDCKNLNILILILLVIGFGFNFWNQTRILNEAVTIRNLSNASLTVQTQMRYLLEQHNSEALIQKQQVKDIYVYIEAIKEAGGNVLNLNTLSNYKRLKNSLNIIN